MAFDLGPEGTLEVRVEIRGGTGPRGGRSWRGQRAFKVMEVTKDIKLNEGERK